MQTIKHAPTGVSIAKSFNGISKKIRDAFPAVETVYDALEPVKLNVISKDKVGAEAKSQTKCVFAKAACRTFQADGAWIGIATTYLIFGNKAIRFKTPQTVARELVTYDRHKTMENGDYRLSRVPKCELLPKGNGYYKKKVRKPKSTDPKPGQLISRHHTARVRVK